jgi:hypothetical protein
MRTAASRATSRPAASDVTPLPVGLTNITAALVAVSGRATVPAVSWVIAVWVTAIPAVALATATRAVADAPVAV